MKQEIAETGLDRFFPLPVPDEKDGREGHDLPEDEEGKVIAGEDRPQGAPHIEETGHVVPVFLPVQGIEGAQEGHDDEYPGKDHAQFVDPAEQTLRAEKMVPPVHAVPGKRYGHNGTNGNKEDKPLLCLPLEEGQEQGSQEKEQRRMYPTIHNNPRPCSKTYARCLCLP